jgi:hypothetical protein
MNPKIIVTAETNFDILQFMAQIISNYLLEKHKITVSEESIIYQFIFNSAKKSKRLEI